MKKYLFSILTFALMTFSFSQNHIKKSYIYFEAGGNGFFGSLNYERQLSEKPGLGFRIGLGFYKNALFHFTVPLGINYLFQLKNEKSFIDAGLSATFTTS
ncbi:MAG: hypothetical protein ACKVQB_04265 [Bacteroidia bacterium]